MEGEEGKTDLVDNHASHIVLRSLEESERSPKVEPNVVLLPLHADPHHQPAIDRPLILALQPQPEVPRQEVAKLGRVEVDVRPRDDIVFLDEIAVVHRRTKPEIPSDGDIERLVPPRLVRLVQGPGLGDAVPDVVAEDEERVELLPCGAVGGEDVLGEDDLDGEEIPCDLLLLGGGRRLLLDDGGYFFGVEFRVHAVEELACCLDVVQLDETLQSGEEVVSGHGREGGSLEQGKLTSGLKTKGSIFWSP